MAHFPIPPGKVFFRTKSIQRPKIVTAPARPLNLKSVVTQIQILIYYSTLVRNECFTFTELPRSIWQEASIVHVGAVIHDYEGEGVI